MCVCVCVRVHICACHLNLFAFSSSCQFVVSASGDYSVHSGDPDRLVDWDKIEQVVSIHFLSSMTCLQACRNKYGAEIEDHGVCMLNAFHDWFLCVCVSMILFSPSEAILPSNSFLSDMPLPTKSRWISWTPKLVYLSVICTQRM